MKDKKKKNKKDVMASQPNNDIELPEYLGDEENIPLSKDQAITVYSIFRTNLIGSINLHREHSKHYLMFVAAIIAATVAGLSQIDKLGKYSMLLTTGPLLNIIICVLAVKMADRFYKGFLEEVSITAKLEDIIGLTSQRSIKEHHCFKEDDSLVPERWLTDRKKHNNASDFESALMNKGANLVNRWTFFYVGLINIWILFYLVSHY